GVLDDLELAVLALGDDVLGDELAVGDLLGDRLHHGVVRPDRVGRDDVDVGEGEGFRHRLAARDQEFLVLRRCRRRSRRYRHDPSPSYTVLWCAFSPGMPAVISTPPASRSALSSCSYWPRKRKPCDRTVAFLSPILPVSQVA